MVPEHHATTYTLWLDLRADTRRLLFYPFEVVLSEDRVR